MVYRLLHTVATYLGVTVTQETPMIAGTCGICPLTLLVSNVHAFFCHDAEEEYLTALFVDADLREHHLASLHKMLQQVSLHTALCLES
jgi:hypothetical protein